MNRGLDFELDLDRIGTLPRGPLPKVKDLPKLCTHLPTCLYKLLTFLPRPPTYQPIYFLGSFYIVPR